jgi:hypothetical protein
VPRVSSAPGANVRPMGLRERSAGRPRWRVPFHAIEWALEWTVYGLRRAALVELLQIVAAFSIGISAITWFAERGDRRRERAYTAWSIVSSAIKERANGARNEALADLAAHGFSLAGITLADSAWMEGIDLRGADLRAGLRAANLNSANLGCRRWGSCSNLSHANLQKADLAFADLTGADLFFTDLRGAKLTGACLKGAYLVFAKLDSASLGLADFSEAVIIASTFEGTRHKNIGSFKGANVSLGARDSAFGRITGERGSHYTLQGEDSLDQLRRRESLAKAYKERHGTITEACKVARSKRREWLGVVEVPVGQ